MNEIYSVIKRDTLIFLKSNYKYKRREVQLEPETAEETEKHICRRTFNKKFYINICIFKNILRLFILIIKNCMQRSRAECHLLQPKDEPVVSAATIHVQDKCIKENHLSAADKVNYVENYDELSTVARCRKVSLYQCHWPTMKHWRRKLVYGVSNHYDLLTALPSFTSTQPTTKLSMKHLPVLDCGKRISALSILMTVFIAFALIARSVEAGTCWETSFKHFKCDKIFAMNISKAECCGYSQEFSYTDRELTGVEFFFATTIGEGAECAPCMETCKAIKCGENKKCVKRKGRPKCICAPECGQSICRRNRFRAQRKHNIYNEPFHIGYDKRRISAVTHVELNKSPRDIRSLSSENMNINLGLEDVLHQNHNQRKIHIMQSQQSQQKPQYKQKESVHGRLLITANVEQQQVQQQQHEPQPAPRRLQILSNVGIYENEEQKVRRRNKNDYYRNSHDNNESKTKIKYDQDHNTHHRRNKNARVRHIQANSENVNLPNHNNEKLDKYHQQYQHKHQHGQEQQHQQQQQQQHHNRKKHKKLRDHFNPAYTSTPLLSSTSNDGLTTSAATSTIYNTTTATTATTTSTTTKTTPVYALSSPWMPSAAGAVNHQRLLNRGSNSATSLSVQHFDNMHNTNPVCGTDGRTYKTECQLKKRACRTDNPDLRVAYCGRCKTTCNGIKCLNGLTCVEDQYTIPHCITCKIDCPQDDATEIIDPIQAVCGVDGKTYKSTCDINRMICKTGRSIAVAYPGPCRADRITCSDINCGPKQKCLVDLITHEPRCTTCRYKCARKRHPKHHHYDNSKICGVNNRTYFSWCEMQKDSCATGFFIDVKSPGECN